MLWEEMEKYTELTGEDATHVPIMKIGAYLDGYEKGRYQVLSTLLAMYNTNEYPEDLECEIDDYLIREGMKV